MPLTISISIQATLKSTQHTSTANRASTTIQPKMTDSDDDIDPELLELLRQSLITSAQPVPSSSLPPSTNEPSSSPQDTKVLSSAQYITDQAVDVALNSRGTKAAAQLIYAQMQERGYSTKTWSTHALHPQVNEDDSDERKQEVLEFIFTMDLLNFCFWSEKKEQDRFAVEYLGKRWTGYWSLVAALRRAADEGWIPFLVIFLCFYVHASWSRYSWHVLLLFLCTIEGNHSVYRCSYHETFLLGRS